MVVFVDSHCHLQLIDYAELNMECDAVVAAAKEAGVEHLLCVATHPQQREQLFAISKKYNNVSISIGLHPNETINQEPSVANFVATVQLALSEKVPLVAIGETGLDYYRTPEQAKLQQERFRTQIRAAKAVSKPLIIHTRSAKADTLRILTEENASEIGGVFHCFTEDWEYAQQAMDANFHISFSGIVTFKQSLALQEVAKRLPLERMLLETDCPYLAPVPMRGKINRPGYVPHIAQFIADLRGIDIMQIAEATTNNFYSLFTN